MFPNDWWPWACSQQSLLCGAQIAMALVEQGGVLQWWCSCNWWMHLWYILGEMNHYNTSLPRLLSNTDLVTVTSVADNLTNLPFAKQWKLHISKPPYELAVQGGESVTTGFPCEDDASNTKKSVSVALGQLST
jgi:hypothetical protein